MSPQQPTAQQDILDTAQRLEDDNGDDDGGGGKDTKHEEEAEITDDSRSGFETLVNFFPRGLPGSSSIPLKEIGITGEAVTKTADAFKVQSASAVLLPISLGIDAVRLGIAIHDDVQKKEGPKRTAETAADIGGSVAGGFAGGFAGGKVGSVVGGILGGIFGGGVGAIPGAAIGGFVGGLAGSLGGGFGGGEVCRNATRKLMRKEPTHQGFKIQMTRTEETLEITSQPHSSTPSPTTTTQEGDKKKEKHENLLHFDEDEEEGQAAVVDVEISEEAKESPVPAGKTEMDAIEDIEMTADESAPTKDDEGAGKKECWALVVYSPPSKWT